MRNGGKAHRKHESHARLRKDLPADSARRENKLENPDTLTAMRKLRLSNLKDYQNFEEALRSLNERVERSYRQGRQYHDVYFTIIAEHSYEALNLALWAYALDLRKKNAIRASQPGNKRGPMVSFFASAEYRKYSHDVMKRRLAFERDIHAFLGNRPSRAATRLKIEPALARQRVILDRLKLELAQLEASVSAMEEKDFELAA